MIWYFTISLPSRNGLFIFRRYIITEFFNSIYFPRRKFSISWFTWANWTGCEVAEKEKSADGILCWENSVRRRGRLLLSLEATKTGLSEM